MAENRNRNVKAEKFLERWSKFQQDKEQKRRTPLTAVKTQSVPNRNKNSKTDIKLKSTVNTESARDGQKIGKVKPKGTVVASKYMSVHDQKERAAPQDNKEKQKSTNVGNVKRATISGNKSGTPMSVKLQRWKDKKKEEEESKLSKKEPIINRRQTIAVSRPQPNTLTVSKPAIVSTASATNKTNKSNQKSRQNNQSSEVKQGRDDVNKPWQRKSLGATSSTKLVTGSKVQSSTSASKQRVTQKTGNEQGENKGASVSKYTSKLNNFKESPVKSSFNRRHSTIEGEVNSQSIKPTVGILKRKSCIPSFSDDSGSPRKYVRQNSSHGNGQEPDIVRHTEGISGHCTQTPGRSVRFVSPANGKMMSMSQYRKTPNRPYTDSSMRNRLDEWLKKRGKTPSKFRHLMCFDAHLSAKKRQDPHTKRSLSVQELTEQQEAMRNEDTVVMNLASRFGENLEDTISSETEDPVLDQLDTMLEECTILFEAGCPLEDISRWLDSIEKNISASKSSAKFYICKAQILQSTGDLDSILEVFETAVRNGAQPASELASALTTIIKDVTLERERKALRRSALEKQIEVGNVFESSAIKYCVKQVTPFKKRKSSGDSSSTSSQCAVITPVRRSTRRSISNLPSSFQDKTPVYKTLEEMPDEEKKKTLYQPNSALELLLSDEEMNE